MSPYFYKRYPIIWQISMLMSKREKRERRRDSCGKLCTKKPVCREAGMREKGADNEIKRREEMKGV